VKEHRARRRSRTPEYARGDRDNEDDSEERPSGRRGKWKVLR
jgi:hypothetical protein